MSLNCPVDGVEFASGTNPGLQEAEQVHSSRVVITDSNECFSSLLAQPTLGQDLKLRAVYTCQRGLEVDRSLAKMGER